MKLPSIGLVASTLLMIFGLIGITTSPAHADAAQDPTTDPGTDWGRGCIKRCNDPDYCGDGPVDNHYYHYLGLLQCDLFSSGCSNGTKGHCTVWYWKKAYTDCNMSNVSDMNPHYNDADSCAKKTITDPTDPTTPVGTE